MISYSLSPVCYERCRSPESQHCVEESIVNNPLFRGSVDERAMDVPGNGVSRCFKSVTWKRPLQIARAANEAGAGQERHNAEEANKKSRFHWKRAIEAIRAPVIALGAELATRDPALIDLFDRKS